VVLVIGIRKSAESQSRIPKSRLFASCDTPVLYIVGRGVARWFRWSLSVADPSVCRCLTNSAMLPFPHPAQSGRTVARSGLVGIEIGRVDRTAKGYHSRPFGCEVGSQFPRYHASQSPPIIPDGRVSQVRFEALAFHLRAFPSVTKLTRWPAYAPVVAWFAHTFVPGPDCGLMCSVLSSRARACRRNRQVPRVPLPNVGVTSLGRRVRLLRGHYSPFLAPTDSFANPLWLSPTSAFRLVRGVCAGCHQAPLPSPPGLSRRYLCESFLGCLSPYPGGWLGAFAWFFLSFHRPSPSFDRIGFPLPSANTIFHGSAFEAAAISLCSGLPVCSPPRSFLPQQVSLQGSRGPLHPSRTYVATHRICYPPDYGQLAERGLSPRKIRCLVGCSRMMPTFPPSPLSVEPVSEYKNLSGHYVNPAQTTILKCD
jgi:hypothetical protein